LFSIYQKLILLRSSIPALFTGQLQFGIEGKQGLLSYYRIKEEEQVYIIMNFRNHKISANLLPNEHWVLLFSTHDRSDLRFIDQIKLSPFEALILKKD
ncbi:MAG: DUF3459 domain-containing protein, partial [Bacteroidetes bacterium]|nr:DUF3459 domain-containing protein [Bacteroidota bacterium]